MEVVTIQKRMEALLDLGAVFVIEPLPVGYRCVVTLDQAYFLGEAFEPTIAIASALTQTEHRNDTPDDPYDFPTD